MPLRHRNPRIAAVWLVLLAGGASLPAEELIDATSLRGKVLCGYQGWFRCPGDGSRLGWGHWSRDPKRITAKTLTFEMWPDVSEFSKEEKFPAGEFRHAGGGQAHLFSSVHPRTVLRHFQWMLQHGIHGAWLHRFLVNLRGGPAENWHASNQRVLQNVREAAAKTGRIWTISYDMTAMPVDRVFDVLTRDWKRRVDSEVTRDRQYLKHDGKPVVMVWGFYTDRKLSPDLSRRIVRFFKNDTKYQAFLVGGCQWNWRDVKDPAWRGVFRGFDVISPWNVGNYSVDSDGTKWATTAHWSDDLAEARRAGMLYLPVLWPGFGWDNLKGLPAGRSQVPRLKGRFLWRQFVDLNRLKLRTAYVAMFDEVDEATAIFKVTNGPPQPGRFQTYEGLPSDWYLRLTGAGTKMLLGKLPASPEIPIRP